MLKYDLNSRERELELLDSEYHGEPSKANPFPGLRPFGVDECHLFFGRENQVDEILLKLSENRFVSLLGYSGSGKSSLMYCGIIPILYGGFMTETGANWNIVISRPGYAPLDNLAESLIQHDPQYTEASEEDRLIKRTVASAILRNGSAGLIDIAKQYKTLTGDNLFILVDQFEELFRFRDSGGEAADEVAAYIRLLLEAIKNEDVPIYIAITMRSDFIGECAHYPGLTELINKSNYVIPQMTREQMRMAIEGPVAVGGGHISERLVKRILKDIGKDQDQLPIMQHALMRTWDYWLANREKGEPIDFRHYNAVGRLDEALSQHADEAYNQLSKKHKKVAEVLFKALTEKGSDAFGTRRPSTIREVALIAQVEEAVVIEVVEHFRQPGLSLIMPPANVELYSDSVIEISHESLMRIWTRLKAWVEDEDESAHIYKRLAEAADLYQKGRTSLWTPPDLQLALNWRNEKKPTRYWASRYDEAFERAMAFLEQSELAYEEELKASEIQRERAIRRTRNFAIIMAIAAIIAIFLGVFSLVSKIEADRNRELAEIRLQEANQAKEAALQAQEKEAEARKAAENSADLARKAQKETQQALARVEQALRDMRAARAAEAAAKEEAIRQKDIAIAQSRRADSLRVIAENKTKENIRLFNQSLAAALAGKSIKERNPELRALMAKQAYDFNNKFNGKEFNKYIYDALYYALAAFEGEDYNMFAVPKDHQDQDVAIKSLALGAHEAGFYSSGADGRIYKWAQNKPGSEPVVLASDKMSTPYRLIRLSPDEKSLLSVNEDGKMQLYDLTASGQEPLVLPGHNNMVYDARFMPNGRGVLSVGADGTLRFYDFKRKSSNLQKTLSNPVRKIVIDNNSRNIYSGTQNGKIIRISWDNLNKEEVLTTTGDNSSITALAIHPDNTMLAAGTSAGYVMLIDLVTGKEIQRLYGQEARVSDVAFSHKGHRLAAASWDGSIQMWDTHDFDELPYYMEDNGNAFVWSLAFTADDDYLLAGTTAGKVKKWATDNATMAEQICSYLTRNMTPEEWSRYVGSDVDYLKTCENVLNKGNS